MTKIEIERRFLLKRAPRLKPTEKPLNIVQIYISENNTIIRYRLQHTGFWLFSKFKCYKTVKRDIGVIGGMEETEIEISFDDFSDIYLNNNHKEIHKIRRRYNVNGLIWEIDKFKDMELVICEVELNDINQTITIPNFIKDELIMEITGIREFSNYNLAKLS